MTNLCVNSSAIYNSLCPDLILRKKFDSFNAASDRVHAGHKSSRFPLRLHYTEKQSIHASRTYARAVVNTHVRAGPGAAARSTDHGVGGARPRPHVRAG
jgi:hypothetical protein